MKTSSTPRLFSDAASCSSRLEILPYWSSLDLFVLVEILFPKEALLKSNQTHFYSSFILVFSLNERVGNGVIFIMSSCWMSGTVCTSPVCTINRLHVARRPCRPSTGAARTQRSISSQFTVSHVVREDALLQWNPEQGLIHVHVESGVLETATQNSSVSRKLNLKIRFQSIRKKFWRMQSENEKSTAYFQTETVSQQLVNSEIWSRCHCRLSLCSEMQQGSTKWPRSHQGFWSHLR